MLEIVAFCFQNEDNVAVLFSSFPFILHIFYIIAVFLYEFLPFQKLLFLLFSFVVYQNLLSILLPLCIFLQKAFKRNLPQVELYKYVQWIYCYSLFFLDFISSVHHFITYDILIFFYLLFFTFISFNVFSYRFVITILFHRRLFSLQK